MRAQELRSNSDYLGGHRRSAGHGHKHDTERFSAGGGQDVAIPVSLVALYPAPCNSGVNTALEIAIPDFKELMPPEYACNSDFVAGKHREDLPSSILVVNSWQCHFVSPMREKPYASDSELEVAHYFIPAVIACPHGARGCGIES